MKNSQIKIAMVPLMLLSCNVQASKVDIEGRIYFGPEAMYFVQCNSKERWWLGLPTFQAREWESVQAVLNEQPSCDLEFMPCKHQTVPVSGTAVITEEGQYGHLGMYTHQIYFTNIQVKGKDEICK